MGNAGVWKWRCSPTIRNEIYDGETYDLVEAEKVQGWNSDFEFDETGWEDVKLGKLTTKFLETKQKPPVRVIQEIAPAKVWKS